MITETTYTPQDFESGKCSSCSEQSDEIVKGTEKCAECIEADKFYEETMKDLFEDKK